MHTTEKGKPGVGGGSPQGVPSRSAAWHLSSLRKQFICMASHHMVSIPCHEDSHLLTLRTRVAHKAGEAGPLRKMPHALLGPLQNGFGIGEGTTRRSHLGRSSGHRIEGGGLWPHS